MKLTGDTPTILLPIEIGARDLDSRVVLASALSAKGCRVIVAHDDIAESLSRASRRIVFQGKSLFCDVSDRHPADPMIANESAIMLISDEGGIFHASSWLKDILQKHYVDKVRSRNIERICLWGRRQASALSAYAGELGARCAVTGSPRFDLCCPRFSWLPDPGASEAISIGRYILVCTRFTAIAHAEGVDSPFRRKLNPRIWPDGTPAKDIADLWFKRWRHDVHDFAEFVVLIKELATNFRDLTVVLRPHPSESVDFYHTAFATLPNVIVIRDGSALGWIRSAELVIHSNCTTGIEAVLAGRQVVNFLPGGSERKEFDIEVACEAGVPVHTIPEALRKVEELLVIEPQKHVWSERARGILNNLTAPAIPLLVEQTMRVLRDRRIDSSNVAFSTERAIRLIVRRAFRGTDYYAEGKRGHLKAEHVEAIIDGCRSRGIGSGRISRVTSRYAVIEP